MALHPDDKLGTIPRDEFGNIISHHRGRVTFGFRYRQLGTQTIQVTGGNDATDTFLPKEGTTNLVSAAVAWTTSHNATAAAIAVAINANAANHNWVATVSADTVTLRQRRGRASGTISVTVTNDAAVTVANSGNPTGDTDSWTEFVSGATFDGDQYYEFGWDPATVIDGVLDDETDDTDDDAATALTGALVTQLRLYCDGQAFRLWMGGLRAAADASALVQGIPVASATWSDWIEWLGATTPLVIKLAADEELLAEAKYI